MYLFTRRYCRNLDKRIFADQDDHGASRTISDFSQPTDHAHNHTFMHAQVGGNCTDASLNAMMRYVVLKEYGALGAKLRSEKGREASCAPHMLDSYRRMKNMEETFANIKTDISNLQGTAFLERILKANGCSFKKYIEKRSAGGAEERALVWSERPCSSPV
jgi:hypothetical protein